MGKSLGAAHGLLTVEKLKQIEEATSKLAPKVLVFLSYAQRDGIFVSDNASRDSLYRMMFIGFSASLLHLLQ